MRSSLISSPYQSLRVSTRAFSLVELLVVISIIATLSIVAYVGFGEYSTSEKNSKRTADITALGGAVNTYVLEKKTLPEPTANRGYFDENGGYRHSNSGAYGVSSFLSEDILGTYALASHPRDPDTQSYYAYGRSYRTPLMYDLASVIRGNTPIAYLRGTSDGVLLPSLVKGYNTTTFVQDGDTSTLPYHPSQRVMTAYIVSSTGTITRTPVKPLSDVLVTGDRVSVSPGGLARIKSSDGSELLLGSETLPTEVNLSDLSLKDESGLLTRMRLVLTSGEIWIQAPKLREYGGERSDLELETRGVVAAVRGTVFGARAGVIPTSSGLFILSEGTLELTKDGSPLSLAGGSPISPGILDVPEGSPAKSIEIIPAGGPSIPPVKTLTPSEIISIKDSLDEMGTDSEESSLPEVTSYTGSTSGTSGYSLTLRLGRTRAESVRVDGVNTLFPIEKPAYGVYISNITLYQDPKNSFTFSLCKTGKVSGLKCGPSRTLQFGTLSSTPTLVDISDRTSSKIFLTPRVSECLTGEVLYDDTCRSWERIGGAMFETDTEFTGVS